MSELGPCNMGFIHTQGFCITSDTATMSHSRLVDFTRRAESPSWVTIKTAYDAAREEAHEYLGRVPKPRRDHFCAA